MHELRAPVNLQKGKSSAFPSAKKHFKMTAGWTSDFTVMESRCNEKRYKAHREFFDKPVLIHQQKAGGKTATNFLKPMEVYHRITPVRSI